MISSTVVLVVHFCTVVAHSPFLTDCSTHLFPKKDMQVCESAVKEWNAKKDVKRYFEDRKVIGDGEKAIVGPVHCEKDPEADFVPVSSIPKSNKT
jgi:hypothetical protein